ncbi:MAG: hypothetical protein U0807_12100 [Candidatus Binatia bacterium]
MLALVGCTTTHGRLGIVSFPPEVVATKLLRPSAVGRSCATWVLGIPVGAALGTLEEAARHILVLHAEGTLVSNLAITRRTFDAGVVTRRCVEVRGDLAREIPRLVVPVPGGHDEHSGHHH